MCSLDAGTGKDEVSRKMSVKFVLESKVYHELLDG
jgi:hypothetical protein